MILTAVGVTRHYDRVNTGESGKQKGSGETKLSQPFWSLHKDADDDKAIVEVSNTWAILAAKRISADNQESWRGWSRVREIRVEACAISGQEWRKCDHGGPLSPSRFSRRVLQGEQGQGERGREGGSSMLNPGKIRDSMSGSTEHTRPHASFSFSETGNMAVAVTGSQSLSVIKQFSGCGECARLGI